MKTTFITIVFLVVSAAGAVGIRGLRGNAVEPTVPAVPEAADLVCHPPLHLCPPCGGGDGYCGRVCFNCPVLETPTDDSAE